MSSIQRNQLTPGDSGVHPGLLIFNKVDAIAAATLSVLREFCGQPDRDRAVLDAVFVSARTGEGLDELFRELWHLLAMIRVYAKEPGKPADLHKPFVVPLGATVADLARQIHRDLPERMRFARLWGHSRFDGQQVHRTEVLQDKDVVEIHE